MERTVVNCTPHFRLFSDSCQTARERCLQEFWSYCCISGYSKLPMQRLPFSFPSDDRSLPAQPHFSPQALSAAGSPLPVVLALHPRLKLLPGAFPCSNHFAECLFGHDWDLPSFLLCFSASSKYC